MVTNSFTGALSFASLVITRFETEAAVETGREAEGIPFKFQIGVCQERSSTLTLFKADEAKKN